MKTVFKNFIAILLALIATITGFFSGTPKEEADLVVKLSSNPSTGYSWQISMDEQDIISLKERKYESEATEIPIAGASGTEIFYFDAVKDGTVKITFTYCRSWESESDVRTVVYTCESKDGKITVLSVEDSSIA